MKLWVIVSLSDEDALTLAALRRIQETLDDEDIKEVKIPGLDNGPLQEKCFKLSKDEILNEVLEIITRGNMQLFEADYHLELARLHWAWHQIGESGHRGQAQLSLADADALIHKMGCSRRRPELSAFYQKMMDTFISGLTV